MRILFFILFPTLWLSGKAQEIINEPIAKHITRFSFRQYSGGVMVVNAKFENIPDTLNFILDTGSGGISLDSSTCREFNIPVTATDTTITGIGGVRKVPFAFDKTLHFPSLSVSHLNFHINDYNLLSSVYGEKIDGVIGYSFFSKYIVSINFDSNFIDIYSLGKFNYPKKGYMLKPIFTALPIQWASLKDRSRFDFNFYIDTGAGLYLLLNEKFVKDSSILLSRRKPVLTQAEGMSGKSVMKLTVIKEFRLGPYKFRNIPTYIFPDDYNVINYPFIGGLIGNDLMRKFNLVLNYSKREIHMLPNKHFDDSFDYAYTGLSIYYVNGEIIIEDIIPKSPGAKAGLMVDDVIMAVNGNISNNIQVYKDMLQTPGATVNLVIKRNNKNRVIVLYTESIR